MISLFISFRTKEFILKMVSLLFILLFSYAAANQLLELETFQSQLEQSPFIRDFAEWLIWLIPAAEMAIVASFFFPRLWRLAFIASSVLMTLFTAYIIAVLNFADSIPCSCGGVIPSFSWQEHLLFNILCVLLALLGVPLAYSLEHSKFQRPSKQYKDFLLQQKQGKPKT